jgi:hypothetical protein
MITTRTIDALWSAMFEFVWEPAQPEPWAGYNAQQRQRIHAAWPELEPLVNAALAEIPECRAAAIERGTRGYASLSLLRNLLDRIEAHFPIRYDTTPMVADVAALRERFHQLTGRQSGYEISQSEALIILGARAGENGGAA